MADLVDITTEQQQEIKPINKYDFSAPSKQICIDCDEPIPLERQRLGGVTRCAECQSYEDNKRD